MKNTRTVSGTQHGFRTIEIPDENHIRTAEELGLNVEFSEAENYVIYSTVPNANGGTFPEWSFISPGDDSCDIVHYTFPPELIYLGEEDREAAGYLLGNWMAYTEDVYDKLIGIGIRPEDLAEMIIWKRDE